jgi:hypothetical protein
MRSLNPRFGMKTNTDNRAWYCCGRDGHLWDDKHIEISHHQQGGSVLCVAVEGEQIAPEVIILVFEPTGGIMPL